MGREVRQCGSGLFVEGNRHSRIAPATGDAEVSCRAPQRDQSTCTQVLHGAGGRHRAGIGLHLGSATMMGNGISRRSRAWSFDCRM